MADNRTEKATPRRREEARKKGQLARGAKLPAAISFLAALLVMRITGNDWLYTAKLAFTSAAVQVGTSEPLTLATLNKLILEAAWSLSLLTLPVISAVFIASIAGNYLQDGFSLTPKALIPRWERFNPVANVKRIFSSQTLVELIKNVIELSALCVVCYGVLSDTIGKAPTMVGSPAAQTILTIGTLAYEMGIRIGGIMVLFAALDYAYKWYSHEKSLRMTKQEVRDEFRHQEGDPLVKSQRRKSARALIQRRLTVEVPKADVVVTNPTHYAVALQYDPEKSHAPVVLAKGADLMARRIREIAKASDVPIIENPPLARVLYRDVEPGQVIPPELFRAVAEILAYVYKQREGRA